MRAMLGAVAEMRRTQVIVLFFSFGVFALLVYVADYFSIDDMLSNYARTQSAERMETEPEVLPLILEATKFHSYYYLPQMAKGNPLFPPGCPVRCRISQNISDYAEADVALFHLRNIELDTLKLSITNPHRLNVLYSYEAPVNEQLDTRIPKDFFNLTLTHSALSSVTDWNDALDPIEAGDTSSLVWSDAEVDAIVANKTQLAVKIASHCSTHSLREVLVKEIQALANITLLGACYSNETCDGSCYWKNIEKSFFYLAFENAVCPDYVTEKFWRLKQLAVPVVLKRSVVGTQAAREYFLAADDFPSVAALVDKLIWYSKNLNAYKKFLGWTKKYRKTYKKWNMVCDLCQLAYERSRYSIPDVHAWWNDFRKRCEAPGFASRVFAQVKAV